MGQISGTQPFLVPNFPMVSDALGVVLNRIINLKVDYSLS
jgi:hypothetical protein